MIDYSFMTVDKIITNSISTQIYYCLRFKITHKYQSNPSMLTLIARYRTE